MTKCHLPLLDHKPLLRFLCHQRLHWGRSLAVTVFVSWLVSAAIPYLRAPLLKSSQSSTEPAPLNRILRSLEPCMTCRSSSRGHLSSWRGAATAGRTVVRCRMCWCWRSHLWGWRHRVRRQLCLVAPRWRRRSFPYPKNSTPSPPK